MAKEAEAAKFEEDILLRLVPEILPFGDANVLANEIEKMLANADRAIVIDRGTIMVDGRPHEMIPGYQSSMTPEVVGPR